MTRYTLPIVIEQDENGYFVECPSLQGCYSQGATYEEAISNIRDAMQLHVADRLASGEAIPIPSMIAVATLEIVA